MPCSRTVCGIGELFCLRSFKKQFLTVLHFFEVGKALIHLEAQLTREPLRSSACWEWDSTWQFVMWGKQNPNCAECEWRRGGWEGGEDGCKHFRWATCYCRSWNVPKNAKESLPWEQIRGCELPGSRTRSCLCLPSRRQEPHPAGAAGPASSRGSRGGEAEIPAAPEPRRWGRAVGLFWFCKGCQGGQHRGLPAQILLLCGSFSLERLLHFFNPKINGRGPWKGPGVPELVH